MKINNPPRSIAVRFQGPHGVQDMDAWLASADLELLRAAVFIDMPMADLSWISSATNLTNLTIKSNTSSVIDLSELKKLHQLDLKRQPASKIIGLEKLENIWHLECRSWLPEDVARMAGNATLVDIFGPPETLMRFEETKKIDRLRIIRGTRNPVEISALGDLQSLKELEFDTITKGVTGAANLDTMQGLESLIIDCKIDDLEWVARLPNLNEFWVSPKNIAGTYIDNLLFFKNISVKSSHLGR